MPRDVLRLFAACALATPALFFSATSLAQDDEEAGHSRGGYAWGEEHHDETASGPAAHHYGRAYVGLGVGGSVRIVQYVDLNQDRLAPAYLQLRGGYFFESDGLAQHGVVLGVATPMTGDGIATPGFGVDGFTQYSIAPAYMIRLVPDGDLGEWFNATGRLGIALALGEQFSWGWEAGVGMLVRPLAGLGIYGEIDFSQYFAQDNHPLLSFEIGVAIDYEVLP